MLVVSIKEFQAPISPLSPLLNLCSSSLDLYNSSSSRALPLTLVQCWSLPMIYTYSTSWSFTTSSITNLCQPHQNWILAVYLICIALNSALCTEMRNIEALDLFFW